MIKKYILKINELYLSYGFIGLCRLIKNIVLTKLFFVNCRLIRFPFYIRGRKYITFSKGFTSGIGARLECFEYAEKPKLYFGVDCQINDYVHIACTKSITIGNNVLIASKVFITDHNHGNSKYEQSLLLKPSERELYSDAVVIGDNVWIGENVVILPGVVIGNNSVIGASAVVTKSVPPFSIVAGNPAKVLRHYESVKKDE